jgi:hypothetical protein
MTNRPSITIAFSLTLCLALGLAGSASAAEDLTIVSRVTAAKSEPTTSTQYLTPDKMRVSNGQMDTIVDLGSGKLILIDHDKKRYSETTFEEMRQYFDQMEEMLESTPMMAQMMGKVSDVQVEKTSETRQVAGYECTKHELSMGDNFRQTVWVTDELEFPVEYYEASKALFAMMGPMAARFEKMMDEVKAIGGFALATDSDITIMGRDASSSSEAIEVKKGAIPDDVFAPPADYKQTKKSPFAG